MQREMNNKKKKTSEIFRDKTKICSPTFIWPCGIREAPTGVPGQETDEAAPASP